MPGSSPERVALLRAIAAEPDCDTRRLAYADWLMEHGDTDQDEATAEFIRLSCGWYRKTDRLSVKEGKWLETGWPRLLPSFQVVTAHPAGPVESVIGIPPMRNGRWVEGVLSIEFEQLVEGEPVAKDPFWPVDVRAEFWRGFVRRVLFFSLVDLEDATAAFARDQPLAEPDFVWVPHHSTIGNSFVGRDELGSAWRHLRRLDVEGGEFDERQLRLLNDPLGIRARRLRREALLAEFRRHTFLEDARDDDRPEGEDTEDIPEVAGEVAGGREGAELPVLGGDVP